MYYISTFSRTCTSDAVLLTVRFLRFGVVSVWLCRGSHAKTLPKVLVPLSIFFVLIVYFVITITMRLYVRDTQAMTGQILVYDVCDGAVFQCTDMTIASGSTFFAGNIVCVI